MGKPSQSAKIHVQDPQKSAILRIFEILKASDTGQKISFHKKIQNHQQILLLKKPETRNCPECACIPSINELSQGFSSQRWALNQNQSIPHQILVRWTDGQTDKYLEDLAQLEVENQTDQSLEPLCLGIHLINTFDQGSILCS